MKAAFLVNPSSIEEKPLIIKDIKVPRIDENEVLIRVEECGLCKIDLDIIEGKWSIFGIPRKIPLIPGHEILGVVEEVGSSVKEIKVNDLVGLGLIYDSCGYCDKCFSKNYELCDSLLITGESADGGLSQYVKVKAEYLLRIPNSVRDIATVLICDLAFAHKSLSYLNSPWEEEIAIIGEDLRASLAYEIAKQRKLDVKLFKKKIKGGNSSEEIFDLKNMSKSKFDLAIVTYSSSEIIENALKSLKKDGKLVLLGSASIKLPVFLENKRIINCGIPNLKEIRKIISESMSMNFDSIRKKYFRFEAVNEALYELKYSNEVKIIVKVKS